MRCFGATFLSLTNSRSYKPKHLSGFWVEIGPQTYLLFDTTEQRWLRNIRMSRGIRAWITHKFLDGLLPP